MYRFLIMFVCCICFSSPSVFAQEDDDYQNFLEYVDGLENEVEADETVLRVESKDITVEETEIDGIENVTGGASFYAHIASHEDTDFNIYSYVEVIRNHTEAGITYYKTVGSSETNFDLSPGSTTTWTLTLPTVHVNRSIFRYDAYANATGVPVDANGNPIPPEQESDNLAFLTP